MSLLGKVLRLLRGLLYPELCPVCGDPLEAGERTVCIRCRWDMPLTDYWQQPDNPLLRPLSREIPGLESASALFFFHHDSRYRQAIHALKYNGRRDIARSLGEMYGYELARAGVYGPESVLIPVPLHWRKRIRRGYNQAEEICRGISKSTGIPTDFRSLSRRRHTRSQAVRRHRQERKRNVENAFDFTGKRLSPDCHIILVDDVTTTGATLAACAGAIRRQFPEARISVAALAAVKSTAPR